MKKQESAKLATRSGRLRRHNRLRRLHRWFGLASLLFILVLSLTGLGLNHADDLDLGNRYLDAPWLLRWYGFDVPPATVSFAVAGTRATLLGNRLYLGGREAARGVDELIGALPWDGLVVVASAESLLYLSPAAELVDRLELGSELPGPIEAIGTDQGELVVRSAGRLFAFDEQTLAVLPLAGDLAEVAWSEPSAVPSAVQAEIAERYRGPGVSMERLLFDLHNGRLFARAGVWFLDVAGVLLVVLSITGLVLFIKRRR